MGTQPRLILLDNFETPYNALDGAQKQVEDILRRITMLSHVAVLVTMRGRYPPCNEAIGWQSKYIQPTDKRACLRIYQSIYPDSEYDPDVGRLLGKLGYMPFAVTLDCPRAGPGPGGPGPDPNVQVQVQTQADLDPNSRSRSS